MDFGKLFEYAKMPAMILVGMGLLAKIVAIVSASLGGILGLLFWPLGYLVLVWAGFNAVKKGQVDLVGAAVVAALASIVAGIVSTLVGGIIDTVLGNGGVLLVSLIALPIALVINAVIALVCGAIGSFVAGMMK